MSIRIVKNQTPSPIGLDDLSIIVPASGEYDLASKHSLITLAESEDLLNHIANGDLKLNTGDTADVEPLSMAIDIIRNIPQRFSTTADSKMLVNATPKPHGTTFHMTSRTDGVASISGDLLHIDHTVFQFGQDTQSVDQPCGTFVDNGAGNQYSQYWLNTQLVEFDNLGNRAYIYDGGISWIGLADNGAKGLVAVSVDAVPKVFDPEPYVATPGTGNSAIVDGYLVVPMPGLTGGTHNLPLGQTISQTPQPMDFVAVPPSIITGTWVDPVFWSIDYDLTEEKFFNLLPVNEPYAALHNLDTSDPNILRFVGNIFTAEVPLASFLKDLLLVGDSNGFFDLESTDPIEIGYGTVLRVDAKTIVNSFHSNVAWTMTAFFKTYRESTI